MPAQLPPPLPEEVARRAAYLHYSSRALISQFAFTALNAPPYHEAIAITKTGDPTGAYYLYDFILPGNEFPDYPKFGVWPDCTDLF